MYIFELVVTKLFQSQTKYVLHSFRTFLCDISIPTAIAFSYAYLRFTNKMMRFVPLIVVENRQKYANNGIRKNNTHLILYVINHLISSHLLQECHIAGILLFSR